MQRILSSMRKTIDTYNLINEGDKIAVGLSGGKDSICLVNGLKALQRFYPKKFEIIAISINPGFEYFDSQFLHDFCKKIDVDFIEKKSYIKEIVFDIKKEKNPCSLCANLRRGIINSVAVEQGCNKIALGHNEDDVIETFLMNLLYTGSISTFAPSSYMDRSKLTLIRPLILTSEKEIKKYITRNKINVIKKVCPMDGYSKREFIKELIKKISKDIPMVRSNLIGSIKRSSIKGWNIDQKSNLD